MTDKIPRWPRSNYPDFNNKKFDYSRDSNLNSYLKTADQLGVNISIINSDKIEGVNISILVDKVCSSQTIHEATVYSDILWDAYNSYEEILDRIKSRLIDADKKQKDKLLLLIKYLKMDTGLNRRPIDGKHYTEIEKDSSYFRQLSLLAKEIINQYSA
jgi:hypothetical protein